jgi:L-lactate dehydrogenase (cytochrome)
VMRDMSKLDMGVTTLGQTMAMPVALAPVGMSGMYARRGRCRRPARLRRPGFPCACRPWGSAAPRR